MKKLFMLLSIALILSSCNSLSDQDDLCINNQIFDGKYWKLIEINGVSIDLLSNDITIKFEKDKNTVVGDNSCNNYCGEYKIEGNVLNIKSLIATKVACTDNNIEEQYMLSLIETNYYSIYNNQLVLKDESGKWLTKFKNIQ